MTEPVFLQDEKVVLVPFEEKFIRDENYLRWLRDYQVMKTINRLDYLRPVSDAEVEEYCRSVMTSKNEVFLAVLAADTRAFIGTVRAHQINWFSRVTDVGILIGDRSYWGKGIGTNALALFCDYLFNRLSMRRLTCGMMANNQGMVRVFEKLGFQREGLLRGQNLFENSYVDHILMGCMREEFIAPASDNKL